MGERIHRSVMNIKVGMFFYIISIIMAFFSRRIFLDCLGVEFIGLTGMLSNILTFLSVAELGIGSSIIYFLFKPLQEDNYQKINEVMSMLAFLYRCIGFTIGGLGIIISIFFPWWFGHLSLGLSIVYFAFYAFLAQSITGYILNYRQLLLAANQKQYVVSAYFQTIGIVQYAIQIVLAWYWHNLYLWVVVGFVFTIIGCIILNWRISKEYPWLTVDLKTGRKMLRTYPEVLKKTRQIFTLKMKDFILYRSDEILVGTFVSVTKVAFYGNYTMIINKLIYVVNILADGMSAGVGNLIAEGNKQHIMKVFWEITATRFFIMGMVIYPLLLFFQPTISCWVGSQYLLPTLIAYLLIFNLFLRLQYNTVNMFIVASGLYSDVWTNWTELIINLTVTLALAPHYGIVGILAGKIISVFFFFVFWKPYFLFSKGFHESVWVYWRGMAPYFLVFFFFAAITFAIKWFFVNHTEASWPTLIGMGVAIVPLLLLLYFLTMFACTTGMKYFVARKPRAYQLLIKIMYVSKSMS